MTVGASVSPVRFSGSLARHSTPVLTIGRYGHTDMQEMTEAIDKLPLPGSAHTSPFASLSRSDLEEFAEGLTTLLVAVWNAVLFYTPDYTRCGTNWGCSGTRGNNKTGDHSPVFASQSLTF